MKRCPWLGVAKEVKGYVFSIDSTVREVIINGTGDYTLLFQNLEEKLSASLQAIIRGALSFLRTQLELELRKM